MHWPPPARASSTISCANAATRRPSMHEAETMLDLFTSVGAHSFDVTFTDVLGNKAQHDGYFGKRIVPSMRFNLPKWTRRAADLEAVKVDENRTVMAGLN